MLRLLAAQLDALDVKLKLIETRLMALHRENPVSQCLVSQPGIGPIGAVSFALRVTDPKSFRSGRHFAAWLGLIFCSRVAAARHGQRREGRQPETCAIEPLDPQRQHVAVEAERQNGEGGSVHRRAAKERHRDTVVHLLVRQQPRWMPRGPVVPVPKEPVEGELPNWTGESKKTLSS
jgi:hypothetical protein